MRTETAVFSAKKEALPEPAPAKAPPAVAEAAAASDLRSFVSEGLASLVPGSEYLAHRPKGTRVEVAVRCRSRVARVVASLDETVGRFRRRVALAFGLEAAYSLGQPLPPAAALKLVFKVGACQS